MRASSKGDERVLQSLIAGGASLDEGSYAWLCSAPLLSPLLCYLLMLSDGSVASAVYSVCRSVSLVGGVLHPTCLVCLELRLSCYRSPVCMLDLD